MDEKDKNGKYNIKTIDQWRHGFCMLQAPTWVVMLVKSAFTPIKIVKGAGLFQRADQTKVQAGGRGTSRYLNGIKS